MGSPMKGVLALVSAVVLLGGSRPVPSPEERPRARADCAWCTWDYSGSQHWFYGAGCGALEQNCFDCLSWNNCHNDWQPGLCWDWHRDCQLDPLSVRDAVNAVEGGDAELLALVGSGRDAVYNPARGAVQVVGCRGEVVAHLPLSDRQVALLERAGVAPRASAD